MSMRHDDWGNGYYDNSSEYSQKLQVKSGIRFTVETISKQRENERKKKN